MPTTYRTFIVGSLALAGIIPFAGFWSKDEILATLGAEGYTLVMWIAIAGAFVTAFYMARAVALTFHGTFKGAGEPHEAPRVMTGPLIGLAIPSIVVGFLNVPGLSFGSLGNFTDWLGVRQVAMGDHHAESIEYGLAAIGLIVALAGIAIGWLIFSRDRDTQKERDTFQVPALYPLLRQKYYMDHVALAVVGGTKGPVARFINWTNDYIFDGMVNGVGALFKRLGSLVYGGLDQRGVDGVVHGLSSAADSAGSALRKMQTGQVQQYAASFVTGALILVAVFVFVT